MAPALRPRSRENPCPPAGAAPAPGHTSKTCGVETAHLGAGCHQRLVRDAASRLQPAVADAEVDQRVAENWPQLNLLVPPSASLGQGRSCPAWPAGPTSSHTGQTAVWEAIHAPGRAGGRSRTTALPTLILEVRSGRRSPARGPIDLPDFTATERNRHRLRFAPGCQRWCWFRACARCPRSIGFTRIDSPEWESCPLTVDHIGPIARDAPTWVPCAQTRGEGIFLRFSEDRIAAWEGQAAIMARGRVLAAATTSGVLTGGWCPANGPACGTSCCTPSPTR